MSAAFGEAEFGQPELFDGGRGDHVARVETVENFNVFTVVCSGFDRRAEQMRAVDDVDKRSRCGPQTGNTRHRGPNSHHG